MDRIGLWLLTLLLVACADAPPSDTRAEGPAELPLTSESPPVEPTAEAPALDFKALREQVSLHLRREDYEAALSAIDQAQAAATDRDQRQELENLRVTTKRHLLQSTVADAFVLLDRDRVALGDPITGELILVNLSRSTLTIPSVAGSEASTTTMQVEVDFQEFGIDGTVVNERITWNLETGKDLVLAPGERHAWPISLDTLQQNPQGVTFRNYSVSAILYPAAMRMGEGSVPGTLRFRQKSCGVFPRNYEHLAESPRTRLLEAIEKESPLHIPVAAALLDEKDKAGSVGELLAILGRRGDQPPRAPTRVACCVALRILTGEPLEADPMAWQAWASSQSTPP